MRAILLLAVAMVVILPAPATTAQPFPHGCRWAGDPPLIYCRVRHRIVPGERRQLSRWYELAAAALDGARVSGLVATMR